jgi:hypothetical protein
VVAHRQQVQIVGQEPLVLTMIQVGPQTVHRFAVPCPFGKRAKLGRATSGARP